MSDARSERNLVMDVGARRGQPYDAREFKWLEAFLKSVEFMAKMK